MQRLYFSLLITLLGLFVYLPQASAALSYGGGIYTNICGTGLNATANLCNRGCNPGTGSCSASGNVVVKFTCNGRLSECRDNESSFATNHSLNGASCGKTVQIDVFNKNCRANGSWNCQADDMLDYMVWYSGDCQTNPTPTPTPTPINTPTPTLTKTPRPTKIPTSTPTITSTPTHQPSSTTTAHASSCDNLSVVSGYNSFVPATVVLRARGSDNLGNIKKYRFYFGDGQTQASDTAEITHRYETSGQFAARGEIQDSRGRWRSSAACEATVGVKSLPVESHKSGCSTLYITSGNNTQAPTTATFQISGFDNKGSITRYKVDFGNGQTQESVNNDFSQAYKTAGTYTVSGYIKDSAGNWLGGESGCKQSLYIATKPLVTQPATGTPTWFTFLGIGSGLISLVFWRRTLI